MSSGKRIAKTAADIESRIGTGYPEPFRNQVQSRSKRRLGDAFGLTKYGVNLVELPPGQWSSQRHWHTHEDEFVYVVAGELTLVTDEGEEILTPGMMAGFKAGVKNGHHLVNAGSGTALYLEVGDRNPADEVFYPDIDMQLVADGEGQRVFTRRDGSPYPQARG